MTENTSAGDNAAPFSATSIREELERETATTPSADETAPEEPTPDESEESEREDASEDHQDDEDESEDPALLKKRVAEQEKGVAKLKKQIAERDEKLKEFETSATEYNQFLSLLSTKEGAEKAIADLQTWAKSQYGTDEAPSQFEFEGEQKLYAEIKARDREIAALKKQVESILSDTQASKAEAQVRQQSGNISKAVEAATGWKPTVEQILEAKANLASVFNEDPAKAVRMYFVDEITKAKAKPATKPAPKAVNGAERVPMSFNPATATAAQWRDYLEQLEALK